MRRVWRRFIRFRNKSGRCKVCVLQSCLSGAERAVFTACCGNQPERITVENIQLAAKEAGLGQKMAMGIWEEMENNFIDSLEKAALQLQNNGLKNVGKIKQQIIQINREKRIKL